MTETNLTQPQRHPPTINQGDISSGVIQGTFLMVLDTGKLRRLTADTLGRILWSQSKIVVICRLLQPR